MVKLVIFDLDGVLIDSKEYHFKALNLALGEEYKISREEHLSEYDGLPTLDKLKLARLHVQIELRNTTNCYASSKNWVRTQNIWVEI